MSNSDAVTGIVDLYRRVPKQVGENPLMRLRHGKLPITPNGLAAILIIFAVVKLVWFATSPIGYVYPILGIPMETLFFNIFAFSYVRNRYKRVWARGDEFRVLALSPQDFAYGVLATPLNALLYLQGGNFVAQFLGTTVFHLQVSETDLTFLIFFVMTLVFNIYAIVVCMGWQTNCLARCIMTVHEKTPPPLRMAELLLSSMTMVGATLVFGIFFHVYLVFNAQIPVGAIIQMIILIALTVAAFFFFNYRFRIYFRRLTEKAFSSNE